MSHTQYLKSQHPSAYSTGGARCPLSSKNHNTPPLLFTGKLKGKSTFVTLFLDLLVCLSLFSY